MTQDGSAHDGAQAAQRRADAAGANSERNRQWFRGTTADGPAQPGDRGEPAPDASGARVGAAQGDPPDEEPSAAGIGARPQALAGTGVARDQAARMHDNAATMHDQAVRLGIGDSEEHRRSAARHREAATSHRPPPEVD